MKLKVCTYNILDQGALNRYLVSNHLNINGLPWNQRKPNIFENMDNASADIYLLQEVSHYAFPQIQASFSHLTGYYAQHPNGSHGVAIFFNPNRFTQLHSSFFSSPLKDIQVGNRKSGFIDLLDNQTKKVIRVATGHFTGGPNRSIGNTELTSLLDAMDKSPSSQPIDAMILGGDFNESPSRRADRLQLVRDQGYVDDGNTSETEIGTGRKLDHIFWKNLSGSSHQSNRLQVVPKGGASDHAPLVNRIQFQPPATQNPYIFPLSLIARWIAAFLRFILPISQMQT